MTVRTPACRAGLWPGPAHDEVERWFHDFDGQLHEHWYCTDDEPGGEFDLVDPARADADLAAYHAAVGVARHNGHADLLRERIDGVTGD